MEEWDILNSRGEKVGRTAIRGKTNLGAGEYHLVVHIWVKNNKGEFLIQRRAATKKLMPGEWAATSGAAVAGETSFNAATRELAEELGIASDASTLKFIKRIKRRNSFVDVYFINANMPAESLHLQESEVDTAKWVTKEHLKQMIKEGKFHDYGGYYWSVVFEEEKGNDL